MMLLRGGCDGTCRRKRWVIVSCSLDATGLEETKAALAKLLPRLRRFSIGLTGTVPDGDDLVQGAVERALANLHRFEQGSRLDSWLFRIARNLHLNQIRAARVRYGHLKMVRDNEATAVDGVAAGDARVMLGQVARQLSRLPEEQRAVLILVAVEGMSYRETAEITGLPLGTVTSRVARARLALRTFAAAGNSDEPRKGGRIDDRKTER